MVTVSEAIAAILAQVRQRPVVRAQLAGALGLVLAENIVADLDSPPFDKSLMDGYAVRSADVSGGKVHLRVVGEVFAGQVSPRPVGHSEAIRIMTGAPLPEGADAVVPVEETQDLPDGAPHPAVKIEGTAVPGRNILKRGQSTRRGQCVLSAGRVIRAQEIGALAELGRGEVAVLATPRVGVLSTGDELVDVSQVPGPGQIRNSNEPMLAAQTKQIGAEPVPLGVARDNADDLREHISRGLACDMLLLSGGVSAGKLDLVPAVLAELGVRQVFHKVRVKPGQPVWFGVWDGSLPAGGVQADARPNATSPYPAPLPRGEGADSAGRRSHTCYVFGLPGNPVSSMVCCELFVRTAIRRMVGVEPAEPVPIRARLQRDHFNGGNRPTYHPARWELTDAGAVVEPVKWVGSADLCATVEANAMVLFPDGGRMYPAGTGLDVYMW